MDLLVPLSFPGRFKLYDPRATPENINRDRCPGTSVYFATVLCLRSNAGENKLATSMMSISSWTVADVNKDPFFEHTYVDTFQCNRMADEGRTA
jgi:hypothetical protein